MVQSFISLRYQVIGIQLGDVLLSVSFIAARKKKIVSIKKIHTDLKELSKKIKQDPDLDIQETIKPLQDDIDQLIISNPETKIFDFYKESISKLQDDLIEKQLAQQNQRKIKL